MGGELIAGDRDWDRYTVSDDMMDDEDDEDEVKKVKDGLTVLTDANFDAKTADKQLTVFRVHFPWCSECKSHDHLTKVSNCSCLLGLTAVHRRRRVSVASGSPRSMECCSV